MITIHFLLGYCIPAADMELLISTLNYCIYPEGYSSDTPVVVEARQTTNRDRIVLGIDPRTLKMDDIVKEIQSHNLVLFCSPGSVMRLATIDAYSGELIRQTESYLTKNWGQGINLVKKMSPFIYLCQGPAFALDRFCSAPQGSFDFVIQTRPGRGRTISGITVEGLRLFDVFDFI